MKTLEANLSHELQVRLIASAAAFLQIALDKFYYNNKSKPQIQSVCGAVSTAIELMLKAVVIQYGIEFVYTNMPLEFKLLLKTDTDDKDQRVRNYKIELLNSNYNTASFSECISMFNTLFVDKKEQYHSYFKFLIENRNKCLHSFLPDNLYYHVERTIYLAINLFEEISNDKRNAFYYKKSVKEIEFVDNYKKEMVESIEKRMKKSKLEIKGKKCIENPYQENWKTLIHKCPACFNNGVLLGETESLESENEESGEKFLDLIFWASHFECKYCGLILHNSDELIMVGIRPKQNRSKDIMDWLEQKK